MATAARGVRRRLTQPMPLQMNAMQQPTETSPHSLLSPTACPVMGLQALLQRGETDLDVSSFASTPPWVVPASSSSSPHQPSGSRTNI